MSKTEPLDLLNSAKAVMNNAHAPYSGYRVAAALLTADDTIFTGCNVENASYGLTICAERSAVAAAVSAGFRKFTALAIVASHSDSIPYPCGACRQVLAEFAGPDFPIHIATPDTADSFETLTLSELLPRTFRI